MKKLSNRPEISGSAARITDESDFQDALSAKMANVAELAAAHLSLLPTGADFEIDLRDGQLRNRLSFKDDRLGGDFHLEVSTGRGVAVTVGRDQRSFDGHTVTLGSAAGESLSLDWKNNEEGARTSAEVILEIVGSVQRALAQGILGAQEPMRQAA